MVFTISAERSPTNSKNRPDFNAFLKCRIRIVRPLHNLINRSPTGRFILVFFFFFHFVESCVQDVDARAARRVGDVVAHDGLRSGVPDLSGRFSPHEDGLVVADALSEPSHLPPRPPLLLGRPLPGARSAAAPDRREFRRRAPLRGHRLLRLRPPAEAGDAAENAARPTDGASMAAGAPAFNLFGRLDRLRRHRQSALPLLASAVLSRREGRRGAEA